MVPIALGTKSDKPPQEITLRVSKDNVSPLKSSPLYTNSLIAPPGNFFGLAILYLLADLNLLLVILLWLNSTALPP